MATPAEMRGSARQAPVPSTGTLLVRGSALRVLTLVASVAVGLFLMPFLIHALGDRWYGIWTLIGSITSFYALLDLGLMSAVSRFVTNAIARDEKTNANVIITTALVIFVGAGMVAFLLSVAIAGGAAWFLKDSAQTAIFRQVVLILGADVALGFPFAAFGAVLGAQYRFDVECCLHLVALVLRTTLIVHFISQGYSILALALITFGVNLASRLALAAAARRLLPSLRLSSAYFDRHQAKMLFGYGKHTFVAAAADRIRFQVDTLVVGSFLGASLVTHYAIATRLVQLFLELMMRTLGVVGPVFMRLDAQGDAHRMRETFLLAMRLSVLASISVAGSIIIFGDRFIALWIGEAYRDAYWPLVILTGSVAVGLMQMPSVSFLFATARHGWFAYLNSGEAVANLSLSVILVQQYGMVGVSLGTAIPLLIAKLVLLPRYVCRALQLELHAYYLEIGRAAFLAIASQAPLCIYVEVFGVQSLSGMVAVVLTYYPICGIFLVRCVLPEPDRRRISTAVPALRWLCS